MMSKPDRAPLSPVPAPLAFPALDIAGPARHVRLPRVVDYNTFWTTVGSAAPVIALAAVVSVSDLRETSTRSLVALSTLVMRVTPAVGDPYWTKAKFHSRILLGLVVVQGINVAVQCYALAFALISLADGTNRLHPPLAVALEVCGVAALALTAIVAGVSKHRLSILGSQLAPAAAPIA